MPIAKPKLDPDVEAFYLQLIEKGEATPEEVDLLNSLLSKEKIATQFKVGVNARSLTDRKIDELKKTKESLESNYSQKISELDSLRESLSSSEGLSKKEMERREDRIELLETQIFKAKQAAKRYSDGDDVIKALGLDEIETREFKENSSNSSSSSRTNKEDNKTSFTKEDILKELSGTLNTNARALAKWAVDLRKMEREYYSLTGKELDPEELFSKLSAKVDEYNGDYYKAFKDEYNIESLVDKKKEENLRAKLKKEYDEELDRRLAERSMPSSERTAKTSDFYKALENDKVEEDTRNSGNPMGMDNRSSVVGEAAAFMQKLREDREKREAA